MGRPFKCPYPGCGASENVCKGIRRTKMLGNRRIFRCKKCGRKFTPKHQQTAEVGGENTHQEEVVTDTVAPASTVG